MKANLLLLSAWCLLPCARAELPEPDNVVYGRIAIGPNVLTAARTNVVVEVRPFGDTNLVSTKVLASYRLGQDPKLGDWYAVEIPLGSPAHPLESLPLPTGTNLVIVVKEIPTVGPPSLYYRTNLVLGERGHVERVDFGTIPSPSGFDAWLASYGLTDPDGDADGDGQSNREEYLAGTRPHDSNHHFKVDIRRGPGGLEISFLTFPASGIGYAGMTRYYSLLPTPSLPPGWTNLASIGEIAGHGGTHTVVVPATNSRPIFYRGKVELRAP